MTNLTKDNDTSDVKGVSVNTEPTADESKFEELSKQLQEKEERIKKADYTLSSIEQQIIEKKKELKSIEKDEVDYIPEIDDDVIETKVAETVQKILSEKEKELAEKTAQNLLTGIEDEHQRKVIEAELKNVNPNLPVEERFKIAKRNADLLVKAQANVPDVETPKGATAPSASFNQKSDPSEELAARFRKRAGLL